MTDPEQDQRLLRFQKLPRPVRVFYSRPRLLIAAAAGLATYFLLPQSMRQVSRALIAWDATLALYLALALLSACQSDLARMKRVAVLQDDGRFLILILTSFGAFASIAAIGSELSAGHRGAAQLALSAVTIALAWATVHTAFALHYAHEYYRSSPPQGLIYPGHDTNLDYWDFLYFSFTVGVSTAASDVGITSKTIRRTVLVHAIIAFIFNTALLALMISVVASAL